MVLELPPPPVVLEATTATTFERQPGDRVCTSPQAPREDIQGYNTPEDCQRVCGNDPTCGGSCAGEPASVAASAAASSTAACRPIQASAPGHHKIEQLASVGVLHDDVNRRVVLVRAVVAAQCSAVNEAHAVGCEGGRMQN